MEGVKIISIRCPKCNYFCCSIGGSGYIYTKCKDCNCKFSVWTTFDIEKKCTTVYISDKVNQARIVDVDLIASIIESGKSTIYY